MSLEISHCRARQKRLLDVMQAEKLDLVVVALPAHVQWLTGRRFHILHQALALLEADGRCTLVQPFDQPGDTAADEVVTYAHHRHYTLRNDQGQAAAEALLAARAGKAKPKRIGVEFSAAPLHFTTPLGAELSDVESALYHLRRRKHADEVACIRRAVATCGAMYAHAREIIQPGIDEFALFNQLHAVAVNTTGDTYIYPGNDFQCGTGGGPPRARAAQDGELYVIDISPNYFGYHADTCRVIAVNRRPTDDQLKAWEHIVGVLRHVERTVKPGVSCKKLFNEAQALLDEYRPKCFAHHLGHGIGLFPHEAPHLNPNWDDTFEEGEVFTAEPGLYGPELRGGIRIENDYLVTSNGVELLSPFPEEL